MKANVRKNDNKSMSRAERGALTRQRLLEATIECLAEMGYARMSTNDVVRKTGVSRGALAHHFPSKAHLVAEAAAYLINMRIRYTIEKFRALDSDALDFRTDIETKWKAYEKWFPANIEFMVASRTDPELREHFASAISRYEKDLNELQLDTFKQERMVQYVIGCFVRGLCLERLVNPAELIDEIFEEFVRIMEAAFK
jgi:AcrR family transcriptional regulator